MRIASLAPSATEILFALGLGEEVVAVSHLCDHPVEATGLPQLTASLIPAGLPAHEVDALVRGLTDQGEPLQTLDVELLREEEPDLIVAQEFGPTCGVTADEIRAIVEQFDPPPRVLGLAPATIGEMLASIGQLAEAADVPEAGELLVQSLADRIDAVHLALADVGGEDGEPPVPVAVLNWIDPPYSAGHWVPQMVEIAGGFDLLGLPGEPGRELDPSELQTIEPDLLLLTPGGYDTARATEEAETIAAGLRRTGARRIAVAEPACFTRPGPRLVDGVELLAHTLHPTLAPEPEIGTVVEPDLG